MRKRCRGLPSVAATRDHTAATVVVISAAAITIADYGDDGDGGVAMVMAVMAAAVRDGGDNNDAGVGGDGGDDGRHAVAATVMADIRWWRRCGDGRHAAAAGMTVMVHRLSTGPTD